MYICIIYIVGFIFFYFSILLFIYLFYFEPHVLLLPIGIFDAEQVKVIFFFLTRQVK